MIYRVHCRECGFSRPFRTRPKARRTAALHRSLTDHKTVVEEIPWGVVKGRKTTVKRRITSISVVNQVEDGR